MKPAPDVDEVIEAARALGMTLRPEDALVYRDRLVARLNAIEEFMQWDDHGEEARPSPTGRARVPGYRPTAIEDPFRAWLWKGVIEGAGTGVLAGKTVSFKDHIAVAGVPLTLSAHAMEGYVPDFDATVVTRVLAAGGRVIGKNSMNGPTSAWGSGVPGDFERPLNPHDVSRLTGGSSSGSAVAVAAGEVDISFGGDQGGSIRIPAAFCGTYGLKPTFGLVSHFGIAFGSDQSIDFTGPMARQVEDVAAALDAVAGYDRYDPRQDRTVPVRIDTMGSLADGVEGLRIGLIEEGFLNARPDVRDAVMAAVDVLVAAGATVMRVSVPEHLTSGLALAALDAEGARALFDIGLFGAFAKTYYPEAWITANHALFRQRTDGLRAKAKLTLLVSEFVRRRYRGGVYARAQNVRASFRNAFDRVLQRVDVLAMPTCVDVAPTYVEPSTALDDAVFGLTTPGGVADDQNTKAYNYTGHPALSVPCGKSGGLPIGIQLVGRFYGEPVLLRAAYAFQHSVDWEAVIRLPRPTRSQLGN